MKLSKYEKETIVLTCEGDDTYSVYTFNTALKKRLAAFAKEYPQLCHLEEEDRQLGCATYVIDKARLSLRITAPYSDSRRKAASEYAKQHGLLSKGGGTNKK